MAQYATLVELRAILDPFSTGGATAASLSDTQLTNCLSDAQAELDARLAQRYVVPFASPVPHLVKRMTLDFAAYHAQLDYRRTIDLGERDPFQLRYNAATFLLADILGGRADLPVADDPTPTDVGDIYNQIDDALFDLDDFDLNVVYDPYHGDRSGNRWWVGDA